MNLTKKPVIVEWPETNYVFIEKVGPFQETAMKAWEELHKLVPELSNADTPTGYMALYKFDPQMTYRAGVSVSSEPKNLPKGLKFEKFHGGKYSQFTLTGPYTDLPEASGVVFHIAETEVKMRNDFCIESYANSPDTTPPEKLITNILLPTV